MSCLYYCQLLLIDTLYFEDLAVLLAIATCDSVPQLAVPTSDRLTAMPGLKRKNETAASTTNSGDANTTAIDNGTRFFSWFVCTAD